MNFFARMAKTELSESEQIAVRLLFWAPYTHDANSVPRKAMTIFQWERAVEAAGAKQNFGSILKTLEGWGFVDKFGKEGSAYFYLNEIGVMAYGGITDGSD